MNWIINLLKNIPSLAYYKLELEKLASEHKILKSEYKILKSENAVLKSELQTAKEEIQKLEQQSSQKIKSAIIRANEKAKKRAKSYSV